MLIVYLYPSACLPTLMPLSFVMLSEAKHLYAITATNFFKHSYCPASEYWNLSANFFQTPLHLINFKLLHISTFSKPHALAFAPNNVHPVLAWALAACGRNAASRLLCRPKNEVKAVSTLR